MKSAILITAAICITVSASAQAPLPVLHPKFINLGTLTDTIVNWQAAASPNAKFIAFTSTVGDLRLFNTQTKRSTVIAPSSMWASWPSWARSGSTITFSHDEDRKASVFAIDVDPNSGAVRGNPRRVTLNGGVNSAMSPDGKWVAYNRADNDDATDLLLVPLSGGSPVKVVTAKLAMPTRWSPDGRWIYYVAAGPQAAFPDGSAEYDTYRIHPDGSAGELVMRTAGTWPGLTNDGRFLVTRDGSKTDTLRHALVSNAAGKPIATFTSPLGDEIGHWVDNYRFLTVRNDQRRVLRVATMDGKNTRSILAAGTNVATATFSPDGKHIAVFDRHGSRASLVIMGADGSNRTSMQIKGLNADAQPVWSPDSRRIAYGVTSGATRSIVVNDLATHSATTLVSGERPLSRSFSWRPDSNSLLYSRVDNLGPSPELSDLSIHEVTMAGKDHEVRGVPREALSNAKVPTEIRLADSLAISVGSAGVWAIPYSGAARLVKRETTTRTTLAPNGRVLIHGLNLGNDGTFNEIEVLGLDGIVVRRITLPFNGYTTTNDHHIVVTPDGRSAVMVGRNPATEAASIYRVPLDGSAPRAIVPLPGRFASQLDVAPDGRSILFTEMGPQTSAFVLVDLTAELLRLSSRH